MKKVGTYFGLKPLFFSLIYFWSLSSVFAQSYTIYLGSGEGCIGYDICSIASLKSYSKNDNLLIDIGSSKEDKIFIDFFKESISNQELVFYFSTGFFYLNNNYVLDDFLCESISKETCVLEKGKYEIKDNTDFFRVQF